jgi:signal transduction histidine kinase
MDMIDRNTNRLQKFVTEILTTFKAESGSVSLNKEELDVVSVAKDALSQFPALHTRIRITSPLTVPARADREALFQIFTNLISNAAKHAPESEILLSIDSREDGVHVFVADQGRGIKSEDLKKIFEPFAQSKGNVVRGGGTGLGLAITKKWVEAHGGRIWAESDGVGRGAKFVFILPI